MSEKKPSVPPQRDKPWLFRTYAGHSTAAKSNALYKKNLSKGQTGLSIAFDLPTQTGYDADDPMARGEVGKVGVPVSHIGHMETLEFRQDTVGENLKCRDISRQNKIEAVTAGRYQQASKPVDRRLGFNLYRQQYLLGFRFAAGGKRPASQIGGRSIGGNDRLFLGQDDGGNAARGSAVRLP